MSTEFLTPEAPAIAPASTQLVTFIDSSLDIDTSKRLVSSFAPFSVQAEEWKVKVAALCVPGKVPTADDGKVAKASRLVLKKIRVGAEHMKDELKTNLIKQTRSIDAIYRSVESTIKPLETQLEGVEKYAEIQEAKRQAAVKVEREEKLRPYGVDTSVYNLDVMGDQTFEDLFAGIKAAHDKRIEDARKAEADRVEKERLAEEERQKAQAEIARLQKEAAEKETALRLEREKAEQERVLAYKKAQEEREALEAKNRKEREKIKAAAKAERDRLENEAKKQREASEAAAKVAAEKARKAAADAKTLQDVLDAKAKKEREAVENMARQEREARQKVEAELQKKKDDEEKARVAAEKVKKAAAAAPDADKLKALAKTVRAITLPALTTTEGKALAKTLAGQVEKFAAWIDGEAAKLGK